MNRIISLFLFIFIASCLNGQYNSPIRNKVTLGKQTTADGLVYRGLAADTTRKPSVDTMAYILLDTNTNIIWQYKKAVNNAWTRLNLRQSDTTSFNYVNTYGTQTVNGAKTFTSEVKAASVLVIPTQFGTATPIYESFFKYGLANTYSEIQGGNLYNNSSATYLKFRVNGIALNSPVDALTFDYTGAANFGSSILAQNVGIGTTNLGSKLHVRNGTDLNLQFNSTTLDGTTTSRISSVNDAVSAGVGLIIQGSPLAFTNNGGERMRINNDGNVGIGTTTPQSGYRLHVVDSIYVSGNVSASAYTTRSDYDLKDEIQNISYGINEVMQMQPVKYTYKSNGSTQLGFIAQDLGVITPEVVSFEDKMSVYYNALIPILTKAIQEQNLLIKALEQRILILENK